MTDEPALPLSIDASAREVITEIGNILLNACLGTFGNLLKVQVSFSVPQLNLASVTAILNTLRVGQEGVQYALVVHAGFKLREAEVRGFLVIVLSVASLDRLIRAVEEWRAWAAVSPQSKTSGDVFTTALGRWFAELSDRGIFTTDTNRWSSGPGIRGWKPTDRHSESGQGDRAVRFATLFPSLVGAGTRTAPLSRRARRRDPRAVGKPPQVPDSHPP